MLTLLLVAGSVGAVSVGLSLLGLELGSRLGAQLGRFSELLGAGLIAVGAAILSHVI